MIHGLLSSLIVFGTDLSACDFGLCACTREAVSLNRCSGVTVSQVSTLRGVVTYSGCGVARQQCSHEGSSHKRVAGGTPTSTHAFPWAVIILTYGGTGVRCGGVILSDQLILTAAHCFEGVSHGDVYLYAGKDEMRYYNVHQVLLHVSDLVLHPHYNVTSKKNDVALLKTSSVMTFNSNVRPVCLPASHPPLAADPAQCFFAGYGDTQGTGFEERLNCMRVPLHNDSLCAQHDWLGDDFDAVRDVTFCAGYADGGAGACSGDSGGGLVCSESANDKSYVYGIASWGKGCGERHKPEVYSDVTQFLGWINSTATSLGLSVD